MKNRFIALLCCLSGVGLLDMAVVAATGGKVHLIRTILHTVFG